MIRTPLPIQLRTSLGIPAALGLTVALGLTAGTATAQTATAFQLSADEPVQIEADRLDVRDSEGKAVFIGNVEVVQGEISLRAAEMTVSYNREGGEETGTAGGLGSAGNIRRIDATGGVLVRSGEQVATGDRGTFDMATETVTLTGDEVVLSDAGNVIRGCKLTIAMATGNADVQPCGDGGRVQVLIGGN